MNENIKKFVNGNIAITVAEMIVIIAMFWQVFNDTEIKTLQELSNDSNMIFLILLLLLIFHIEKMFEYTELKKRIKKLEEAQNGIDES